MAIVFYIIIFFLAFCEVEIKPKLHTSSMARRNLMEMDVRNGKITQYCVIFSYLFLSWMWLSYHYSTRLAEPNSRIFSPLDIYIHILYPTLVVFFFYFPLSSSSSYIVFYLSPLYFSVCSLYWATPLEPQGVLLQVLSSRLFFFLGQMCREGKTLTN